MSTHRTTAKDEVFEYVESFDRALHNMDVIGGLPHLNQSTVQGSIDALVKDGRLMRPARAYVQRHPREGEPSAFNGPAWLRPGATPSAKIRAYIEARGPQPKAYVIGACGTQGIREAIDSMVRTGELSYTGAAGSVIRLGAPPERAAQRHSARNRWHDGLPPMDKKPANPAATPEPPPVETPESRPVLELVVADLKARREMGIAKYGRELHTHNGRDTLMDAYQEALDLCMYLRAEIEQRDRDLACLLRSPSSAPGEAANA